MDATRTSRPAAFRFLLAVVLIAWLPLDAHRARAGHGDLFSIRQPQTPGSASMQMADRGLGLAPFPGDAVFSALAITTWREGDVKRLTLDGWVNITIGDLTVSGRRATAWIIQRAGQGTDDPDYNEIAVYIENVSAATRPSGMSSDGDQLLITAALTGSVRLRCDDLNERIAGVDQEMIARGRARLVALLSRPRSAHAPRTAQIQRITPPGKPLIITQTQQPDGAPGAPTEPGPYTPQLAARPEAVVMFRSAGKMEYRLNDDQTEATVTLHDNLVVEYFELGVRPGEREPRHLTLTADKAVLFLDPVGAQAVQTQQVSADAIHGLYLEGQVIATDGSYTLRGPSMFYEFDTNRAIVLDGVFSTYSKDAKVPVYMRADEIRQDTLRQWSAKNVRLSTSEFFTPHISVGASRVTIQRKENPRTGEDSDYVRAGNITLRAGDVPVFWLPGYRGRAEDVPLRHLTVGSSRSNGATIKSEWDLLGLMGWEHSEDVDASLIIDYYSERGPAIGADVAYRDDNSRGRIFGYLIQDDGEDRLASGAKRDVGNETRGIFTWSHRQELPDDWTVIAELSHISDPNFVDAFFDGFAEQRREFMTRLYALQQRDNWAFEISANTDLNHFIPNEDLLQSPGYLVEKVPQLGYYRFADSLFGGRVSWSSEYELSRMRLSFPDVTLDEIGQGRAGFGLIPSTNLSTRALMAGYNENYANRFTTRQEMSMPRDIGIFRVVPFAVGRFTWYDDDFDSYNTASEELWWFGGGGVRIATEFSQVDNTVESRLFDLHRVRHIIEPAITFWSASSDAGVGDYPIYDFNVEGISKGSLVRFGLRNTWQTQRGGEGRWRSVDFLVIDTDVVLHGSETQGDYSIPHFFDYRPEYSRLGDHVAGDVKWLVSDYFAMAGHMIYDLDKSAVARSAVGFRIDHTRDLYTYSDLRYLEADHTSLLSFGLGYTISPLYSARGSVTLDLDRNESQRTNFELTRRLPQVDVIFGVSYDQFREDTTISLSISPQGTGGHRLGGPLNPRDLER